MLKLDEPFRNQEIFSISLFFNSSDLGFDSKTFILKFLVDILPLGSGSVNPHFFADPDPDPESQNLADPRDLEPDPKHWINLLDCSYSGVLYSFLKYDSLPYLNLFNSDVRYVFT